MLKYSAAISEFDKYKDINKVQKVFFCCHMTKPTKKVVSRSKKFGLMTISSSILWLIFEDAKMGFNILEELSSLTSPRKFSPQFVERKNDTKTT